MADNANCTDSGGACCGGACCAAGEACLGGVCTPICWDDAECTGGQVCHLICAESQCDAVWFGLCECDPSRGCGEACPCLSDQICQDGNCVTATTPVCGNGICESGETCSNCPGDCGQCTGGTECATDGDCVPATCCHAGACVPRTQAPLCGNVCDGACYDPPLYFGIDLYCGQGYCSCQSGLCVAVATPWCGDGVCNGSETCGDCPVDCGSCP
jgi:hypothetical protein